MGMQMRPAPDLSTNFEYPSLRENQFYDKENIEKKKVSFVDFVTPVTSVSPMAKKSEADSNTPNREKTIPSYQGSPVPPEILKVLDWQNSQLKLLQEQVQVLLQQSPQNQVAVQSSVVQSPSEHQIQKNTEETLRKAKTQCSVSTNTSMLWPDIQQALQNLKENSKQENESEQRLSNIPENENQVDFSESLSSIRSDHPALENSPVLKKPPDLEYSANSESVVLGESASLYEEQQIQGVYDDILTKVNRLLQQPEPEQATSGNDETEMPVPSRNECPKAANELPTANSDSVALCNRLRQLGVSFINPEDLCRNSDTQAQATSSDVSALFLPRATLPSNSVWQQSPDTSIEASSLALKYLDEEQLSKLAIAHTKQQKMEHKNKNQKQDKLDVNFSISTQQFLERYGLNNTSDTLSSSTDRRPLAPIQNNEFNANPRVELRKQVLKGNFPLNGGNDPIAVRLQERAKPEVKNRILDITAIKNQPKLL